jgi:hypothetical protein
MHAIGLVMFGATALLASCRPAAKVPATAVVSAEQVEAVATTKGPFVGERFPNRYQARLDRLNVKDAELIRTGNREEYVIRRSRIWPCGSTVTVAFKGGSQTLRGRIADATKDWTDKGNVKLDFGSAANGYRSWRTIDGSYAADIRISFDHPEGGYWSLVGKDSVDPQIVRPGEASMNFGGFHVRLPIDWRATVLHEFGHALAFEHEHQFPDGGCDFRWEDDPGYVPTTTPDGVFTPDVQGRRPGLYTYLGGEPNNWPRAIVDHNLQKLPNTRAYRRSAALDKDSIMKYFFEDFFFVQGTGSRCYSPRDNAVLSALDAQGVKWAYPTPCSE